MAKFYAAKDVAESVEDSTQIQPARCDARRWSGSFSSGIPERGVFSGAREPAADLAVEFTTIGPDGITQHATHVVAATAGSQPARTIWTPDRRDEPRIDLPAAVVRTVPDPLPPEAPFARLTMTYAALTDTDEIALVVRGEAKRAVLQGAIAGQSDLPIARLLAAATSPVTIFWTA